MENMLVFPYLIILFYSALYLVLGFTCKQHDWGQWCIVGQQLNQFRVRTITYIVYAQGVDNQRVDYLFFFIIIIYCIGAFVHCDKLW